MVLIVGVDEAGRGPVIGPLVICGILIDEKNTQKLKAIGVKDSKLLTPQQRRSMFEKIKKAVNDYKIIEVSPKEIDAAVESESGMNLNWLEAHKTAELLNILKPDIAYIDCPSTNTSKYKAYLKKLLKKDIKLVVEHKADINYPSCSAASILAKVTRDKEIEKIKKKIGQDIGSGYPSDPITQEFIRKNYKKYPGIFRKSWATYKALTEAEKQKKLDQFQIYLV